MTDIVCISDTHGRLGDIKLPGGDILVFAGDASMGGSMDSIETFARQIEPRVNKYKAVFFVAGNHDWCFQNGNAALARQYLADVGVSYLQDEEHIALGLKFYGSPWTPDFGQWAFMLPRGQALAEKWAMVPEDTDVLITHGPPLGMLDLTNRYEAVGCADLAHRVKEIRPRLHVFGHVHEAYGAATSGTTYVNASICDSRYRPVNKPVVAHL